MNTDEQSYGIYGHEKAQKVTKNDPDLNVFFCAFLCLFVANPALA